MSTTTLTDLNPDCLLLIAEELVNFEAIDSDDAATPSACKDLVSLGSTCGLLRHLVFSDQETFAGLRKDVFKSVKLKSNKKEKIGSLFKFLKNINTVIETLSLPELRVSSVSMTRNERKALSDARRRIPTVLERMDSLCSICPILPNIKRLEIGELITEAFGPRMPNLTGVTVYTVSNEHYLRNISRSWPALTELCIHWYGGPSPGLKPFLIGQNRLVDFQLLNTGHPYAGAVRAWLGTTGVATRVTTLTLLANGLKDNTFISRIALCRNLERLEVNCGKVTDAALGPLGQLANLYYLRLTEIEKISVGGFTKFFENAAFSLRSVDLSLWYSDGDNGLVSALISHNSQLEELELAGRISEGAFNNVSSLTRLSTFKCSSRNLGDGFLDRFDPGALTHLERVAVTRCPWDLFDFNNVNRFKARFPSCRLAFE